MKTYKKNEKLICEQIYFLCNTNMIYLLLAFHTLNETKHQQRTMKIHQPFFIT